MAYFVIGTTPMGRQFFVAEDWMRPRLLMLAYMPDKALSKEQAEAMLTKANALASTASYKIVRE